MGMMNRGGLGISSIPLLLLLLCLSASVLIVWSKKDKIEASTSKWRPGSKGEEDKPSTHSPRPRDYPFCVTKETMTEYTNDLVDGPKILGNALDDFKNNKDHKHSTALQSRCPTCGVKSIKSIKYFRVKTNLDPGQYRIMEYLRQWIHIHIKTTKKMKGLIVQANVNPHGMAYGKFDLEFACKDCSDTDPEIKMEHAVKDKALELGDGTGAVGTNIAAAIPCRRRTYLHVRHPYVYAFATEKRYKDVFHMNYNYLDITCRQTQMIQLMFLWVTKGGSRGYAKTGVINHGFVDSLDGMPYPYHVDFYNSFNCHTDEFKFQLVINGDKSAVQYNADYDACTLASKSKFQKEWRDTGDNFISNKVCAWPMRSRCDYTEDIDPALDPSSPAGHEICNDCNDDDNEFTRKALRRLIGRVYMQRRAHGVAMIVGLVAFGVVSIHLSRYWKETGGGCLLVGWWLWAHLGLLYAAKVGVYIGLVLGVCQAPRLESGEEFDIDTKRNQVIAMHKGIGTIAVILFHVDCIMGPWRPSSPGLRWILILVHAIIGYMSVIMAAAAVIISTACYEALLLTVAILLISLIVWVAAMVLQILMDMSEKMSPGRKYIPVIEAVKVPSAMPMKMVRVALLGVLSFLTLICVVLLCIKGGYKGIFFNDACINCIWKYDHWIVLDRNRTDTNTEVMWAHYKCELKKGMWDKLISAP